MNKFICLTLLFALFYSLLLAGWVLPPSLKTPASYEKIERKTIAEYENQMGEGPITYRSGHYTSLLANAGSFSNILEPGSIILYKTSIGNLGKMKILGYANLHAVTNVRGYSYCDIPFFVFTTYKPDGSILISGGYPKIIDPEFSNWDTDERPREASFMIFYFDFDTNQTSLFTTYSTWEFTGADLSNQKSTSNSKFFPRNGAEYLVVYKP